MLTLPTLGASATEVGVASFVVSQLWNLVYIEQDMIQIVLTLTLL